MTNDTDDTLHVGQGAAPVATPLAAILGTASADENYGGDSADTPITADSLTALRELAQQQLNEMRAVADAAQALKDANKRLANIAEDKLPKLMKEFGMPQFNFIDGHDGSVLTIKRVEKLYVSMPKNDAEHAVEREEIFAWLRTKDLGGSIKETMEINLGLHVDGITEKLQAALNATGLNLDVAIDKKIEPATLTAAVTRLKEAGENIHASIKVTPADFADVVVKTKAKSKRK